MTHTINGKTYKEIPLSSFEFDASSYTEESLPPMKRVVSRKNKAQRHFTAEQQFIIGSMFNDGIDANEISKLYNVSKPTIYRYAREIRNHD